MSLITSMGLNYCREWLTQALMIYEGRPVHLSEFDEDCVRAQRLDVSGRERITIPHDYFTGFKVFEYPPLGYRRVGNVVLHVHRQQSAYRGLRASLLTFEQTPLGYMLAGNERTQPTLADSSNNHARLAQVMVPTYDNRSQLDALIAGRLVGVVPSEDVCIEPSITSPNYTVLYRGKIVGTMNSDKEFSIDNPAVAAAVAASFAE